jgi:ABC-2 type transport system permease protein
VGHRAEPVLATATSRRTWLDGHIAVAATGSTAALVAGGIGLGASAAASMGDVGQVTRLTISALAYVPALLVFVGVAAALVGRLPRGALAVWGLWSFSMVLAMFGTLISFPDVVRDLSPFEHVPSVPAVTLRWTPIALLLASAAALVALARQDIARRDVA